MDGSVVFPTIDLNAKKSSIGYHLWYSDGTEAGTTIAGSFTSMNVDLYGFVQRTLLFSASDGVNGRLWAFDFPQAPVRPKANFTVTPPAGAPPLRVQFADASIPGDNPILTWHWSFGDGTASNEQHPQHVYAANDAYTVSLTVATAVDADTRTAHNAVIVSDELPVASRNVYLLLAAGLLFLGARKIRRVLCQGTE